VDIGTIAGLAIAIVAIALSIVLGGGNPATRRSPGATAS
jgi:flagellar motor component MotA